jgi:hypothetical protein
MKNYAKDDAKWNVKTVWPSGSQLCVSSSPLLFRDAKPHPAPHIQLSWTLHFANLFGVFILTKTYDKLLGAKDFLGGGLGSIIFPTVLQSRTRDSSSRRCRLHSEVTKVNPNKWNAELCTSGRFKSIVMIAGHCKRVNGENADTFIKRNLEA